MTDDERDGGERPSGVDENEAHDAASEERDGTGADPSSADALATALLLAMAPTEIDAEVNERLIAAALERLAPGVTDAHGADEAPATAAETRDAASLREALEAVPASLALRTDEIARLAQLARALKLAYAPTHLDEVRNQAILRGALGSRRTQRIAVVATLLAAAAAFLLFVFRPGAGLDGPGPASASLIPARSTQDLFDPAEPFPREGGTTERIDKIAASRTHDGRQNRFAAWGIE